MRKNILYGLIVLFIVGAMLFFPKEKAYPLFETELPFINVSIDGAVHKPGTYKVPSGRNLAYLIHLAGGMKENANLNGVNLGLLLEEKAYFIESYHQVETHAFIKVNINEATFQELILIPHITENRAIQILLYREQHGVFNHVDELLFVKGIGVATLEKIKPFIYL